MKATLWLASEVHPSALENVPGLAGDPQFDDLCEFIRKQLEHLGYQFRWFVLNAAECGMPQIRRQGVLFALHEPNFALFRPPVPNVTEHVFVGSALRQSMTAGGWPDVDAWATKAACVAPTLVGISANRDGAISGRPAPGAHGPGWEPMPFRSPTAYPTPTSSGTWVPAGPTGVVRITSPQAAPLQGFPPDWQVIDRKTSRYRQIGHASPPPVGRALGAASAQTLDA
ncbi:DNA cytosine methyltransferase [Streptomyces sp. NBC_01003]|uniref:DNA cytosine methyltransferase n=1 Tax=Streptomyces sp. NBC_01003 TaxID=2903714 RepID=UPI003867BFBD